MTEEPTIVCPNCGSEIKLTESLAAPLIEATRREFEQRLAKKDTDVAKREEALRLREEEVSKKSDAIDEVVSEKLRLERAKIAAEESKKARLSLSADLEQKTQEVADLQEVLKERDSKLAEAQKAQAEFMKKQRELEDAKRELDLTVETRVQEGLGAVREQARNEAEEGLKLRVKEKEQTLIDFRISNAIQWRPLEGRCLHATSRISEIAGSTAAPSRRVPQAEAVPA